MAKTWRNKQREEHIKRVGKEGKALVCCSCGVAGGKYKVYVPSTQKVEDQSITLRKVGDSYYCKSCFDPGG